MRFLKIHTPVALLLMASVIGCTQQQNKAESNTPENITTTTNGNEASAQQMPAFALLDTSGKVVDIKSFAGKKVFVNLWASWCPPCRAEMPSIEKLHQSVDKGNAVFLMVSLDNDFETAKKYVNTKGLQLPIYYPKDNLPELFNVRGIPATFIFDETGKLIKQHEGVDDYNTDAYRTMLNPQPL